MSDLTLRVRLDGHVYPVRVHFRHWAPKAIGMSGMAMGTRIYVAHPPHLTSDGLIGHELIHTLDFVRRWNRTPLSLYGLAVLWDVAAYVLAWVRVGFRYRLIPEEVEAYRDQWLPIFSNHPHIQILDGWPVQNAGQNAEQNITPHPEETP